MPKNGFVIYFLTKKRRHAGPCIVQSLWQKVSCKYMIIDYLRARPRIDSAAKRYVIELKWQFVVFAL